MRLPLRMFALALAAGAMPLGAFPLDIDGEPGAEKLQPKLRHAMEEEALATLRNGAPLRSHRVVVMLHPISASRRVLLDTRPGLRERQTWVAQRQEQALAEPVPGSFSIVNRYQSLYGFSADADADALLALARRPSVASIELTPTFTFLDRQAAALTRARDMNRAGATGRGVAIAIIDTGIDSGHKAFGGQDAWPNDKVIGGWDFGDNDPDPRSDCDADIHGTAVAAIAAGKGGGIRGVAPNASLVFVKGQSTSECGTGEAAEGDFIGALDWIVSNRDRFGIKVLSMSFGFDVFSSRGQCNRADTAWRRAIDALSDAGITAVAASGNNGATNGLTHPACMKQVISVGSVYDSDVGAMNFGDCRDDVTLPDLVGCYSNSARFLDVLAPSECAHTARGGGGRFRCFDGTSAAAPYAAGLIAALLEVEPTMDYREVRRLLADSGVPVTDPKNGITTPRVDGLSALEALLGPPPP